jgi:phosphate/sulfate permease
MDNVYIILVGVLLILAISDLVVGVSNDAVNFLNSAIGSKSAPYWAIMVIASFGVLIGTTFSSGMMEVARNGIFNPQMFTFNEILMIFLAVMLTDIILLDTFNTLGLPTSTTVSLVFELLGAAVGIALVQILRENPENLIVMDFINSEKALAIVSSILLSIVLAFLLGIIVQWIVRTIFSFNFEKNLKFFGGIFGGIAITSIIYFMLIKGLSGSIYADKIVSHIPLKDWMNFLASSNYDQFISLSKTLGSIEGIPQLKEWSSNLASYNKENFGIGIQAFQIWAKSYADYNISIPLKLGHWVNYNTYSILLFTFLSLSAIFQILYTFFRFNILKMVVFAGTFALAMAFAGNDLVNFIGVPLAGLKSLQVYFSSGMSPDEIKMSALLEEVDTPPVFLFIAGIIMVLTLWFSKKARSVTATEINLSKQNEGSDRFESTQFSRFIVRQSIRLSKTLEFITPVKLQRAIAKRFEPRSEPLKNNASFDMLRAAVNLTVAAILISIGTAWKLPLSTTYVTFMVAMSTALADGAWGRDSAVYRVAGVTTVIGGWFVTALIAFTVAFLVALSIVYSKFIAVPFLLGLGVFILIKSKIAHKKRQTSDNQILGLAKTETESMDIIERCTLNVTNTLTKVMEVIYVSIINIEKEDIKKLKKRSKEVERLNQTTRSLKEGVDTFIFELKEESIESGHYYVQVLDYLREISKSLNFITKPAYEHFRNQHSGFTKEQNKELGEMGNEIQTLLQSILNAINSKKFDEIEEIAKIQQRALELIAKLNKNHVRRIRNAEISTKNSILYLNILSESKNLVLFTLNLLKSYKDFIVYKKI